MEGAMDLEPATWQLPRWDRVERWPRVSAAHMNRVGCLRPSDGLDGWAAAKSLGQLIDVSYEPEDGTA
jgi:hypothetical protein